jgi:hypothetical protein
MHPMQPTIPPASIHLEGTVPECSESFFIEMKSLRHRSHDVNEGKEVAPLAAQQRLRFEEGDHSVQEILPSTDNVDQCPVRRSAMILADAATPESPHDEIQDLAAFGVLADMELRDELPTGPCTQIPLKRSVEQPFAVNIAGDISIQPFLLIIRTERIFTDHAITIWAEGDIAGTFGYSEFPAFSRIYRQRG